MALPAALPAALQAPPALPAAPPREVEIELLGLHARVLRRMPVVQTVLVIGMGLFLVPHVPLGYYVAWCMLTVGIETTRAVYAWRLLRRGNAIDPARTHRRLALLAAAAGGAVGLGAMLMMGRLPLLDQAVYGAILLAMPAAGVAVSQSSRWIVGAYALTLLAQACGTWMWLHPTQAVAVGLLSVMYCVLIITVAADADKLLLRSVMIRHQRDRLILDLEQRNADVRAAMLRAEQSAEARARVLAAASHDLRQPLHALSLYSAVLAANPGPEMLREVGTHMDQIVRSLGSLLHGLLDLSRLAAGQYTLDRQSFALDQILSGVCAEFRLGAQAKGLALQTDFTPVQLWSDPVAVGRITRNLVDNAIKYSERGTVQVHTRRIEIDGRPWALLDVTDSGPGIAPAEQERIFEEFYQVDNPGRDRHKGVGLGLAIVQRLAELIGARVEVQSQPGEGTRFRVWLPVDQEPVRQTITAGPVAAGVPLQGRRVYLVDDEADVIGSMRSLLGLWGMHTEAALSVAEAEALFSAQGPPELAIIDLRLGGDEHGADMAARLHAQYGHFAVLIVTGEIATPALQAAHERGYTVMHKPIAAEALREAIGQALRRG